MSPLTAGLLVWQLIEVTGWGAFPGISTVLLVVSARGLVQRSWTGVSASGVRAASRLTSEVTSARSCSISVRSSGKEER